MSYREKISHHFHELTAGQKKVARYVLDHAHEFSKHTATEIGKKAGVSETTVIRFCHAVGFDSFMHMQQAVWDELLASNYTLQMHQSSSRIAENAQIEERDLLDEIMRNDMFQIEKTFSQLSRSTFQQVIRCLAETPYILVVGHRTSHAPASWLAYSLNLLRGKTRLYRPDTDDMAQWITEFDSDWVIIALSFRRYAKETVQLAKFAKENGARVLTITDSMIAPAARYSDFVLPVAVTDATLDSIPALFSLLNAIVTVLSAEKSEEITNTLTRYEQIYEKVYQEEKEEK
ncbi:MurR/RpiR family transcriptional regulator [Aneurinibacillus aneurinilyticus]|nr:MurR/RpiR family transcriptional regulator [Aneurinibacillus aneurinilyticus]MED0673080.1 MurR/RpiR family transcriptional regulator [Aneurinibacillus aneurinilyticus]MED0705986.1 MurR/RpiR family transcriptional regulator [Aneurinibacillus aneurinilyticus]MED0721335.1 MurR/RpiR family transcriptional regulator [Aneurinibacillus aneurinilyticus]MED0734528.1 MurR/RpiR family transcriptional regulator [Aneurinibacillus aneurinilyticus]MED0742148.1 MurR/RpiR family transcriptional regulator [A